MQPYRIVEAFDVAEAGDLCFTLGHELSAREELALERREETFAHGIVVGVTDRSHGGPNADLTEAPGKPTTRLLAPVALMLNNIVVPPLAPRHFQSVEHEF